MDARARNGIAPQGARQARGLGIPTLVLCGEKTTEPDRQVTEILHRELPNNVYRKIESAEHMSPLTHPEKVASMVAEHIGVNSSKG